MNAHVSRSRAERVGAEAIEEREQQAQPAAEAKQRVARAPARVTAPTVQSHREAARIC